ncbi:hypothetical protein [Leyella stercorea]|uniref:hypothetical protein n=1 Tax=Leyella stercorea TaxID=363265 RepID=UPI003AF090EF
MNPLTWQNPEQLFVAQDIIKVKIYSVAELRIKRLLSNVECIIYTIIAAFLCIAIIAYIKFRLYKKGIKRKHNKSMSEKTEELQTTST